MLIKWIALICLPFVIEVAVASQNCPSLTIPNGRAKIKQRGHFAIFKCFRPYVLVGSMKAMCVNNDQWVFSRGTKPICASRGCPIPSSRPKFGDLVIKYNSAVLEVICHPGHFISNNDTKGRAMIYCDGIRWNGTLPNCKRPFDSISSSFSPMTRCSFEAGMMCGWLQYTEDDLDWQLVKGGGIKNATVGTGPRPSENGTFLLFESSGDLPEKATAVLYSPIYPVSYATSRTGACFALAANMNGATMGSLKIFVVPESANRYNSSQPIMTMSGDRGMEWFIVASIVPAQGEDFQIAIEATRGSSYLSDIAIKSVELVVNNSNACENLVRKTSHLIEAPTQERASSPSSCFGRCNKNASLVAIERRWREGVCSCDPKDQADAGPQCDDFVIECGEVEETIEAPMFLAHIGINTWREVAYVVGGIVASLVLVVLGTVVTRRLRKGSQRIINRNKKTVLGLTEHSDVRYMVDGFGDEEEEEEDFIDFRLATVQPLNNVENPPIPFMQQQTTTMSLPPAPPTPPEIDYYATVEDVQVHRYESVEDINSVDGDEASKENKITEI